MLNQLPSKWCVCPQNEENLSLIKKWACKFEDYRITFPDNTYTSNKTYITHLDIAINHGYTEITFDDFRKFILKEKSPEELLIEEAKIRYPIGTEFYSALPEGNPTKCMCYGGYIFENKVCEYRNIIWAYDHTNKKIGWLYCDGVWAKTVKNNKMDYGKVKFAKCIRSNGSYRDHFVVNKIYKVDSYNYFSKYATIDGKPNIYYAFDEHNSKANYDLATHFIPTTKEEYDNQFMVKEKTIKLSLDKARKMYSKSPEMDELLLANFSKEELTKKELPKSWDEIGKISGYYITSGSDYGKVKYRDFEVDTKTQKYYHRFATEKQAKSALAMAQLSQLIAVYNDGWEPDWNDSYDTKFVIRANNTGLFKDYYSNVVNFLAFKSAEIRDEFLKNFEQLIKEYFMID